MHNSLSGIPLFNICARLTLLPRTKQRSGSLLLEILSSTGGVRVSLVQAALLDKGHSSDDTAFNRRTGKSSKVRLEAHREKVCEQVICLLFRNFGSSGIRLLGLAMKLPHQNFYEHL